MFVFTGSPTISKLIIQICRLIIKASTNISILKEKSTTVTSEYELPTQDSTSQKYMQPDRASICGVSVHSLFYSCSHTRFKVRVESWKKGTSIEFPRLNNGDPVRLRPIVVFCSCAACWLVWILLCCTFTKAGCGPIKSFNYTIFPITLNNTPHHTCTVNVLYNLSFFIWF